MVTLYIRWAALNLLDVHSQYETGLLSRRALDRACTVSAERANLLARV